VPESLVIQKNYTQDSRQSREQIASPKEEKTEGSNQLGKR
jgi:hypothetical protein